MFFGKNLHIFLIEMGAVARLCLFDKASDYLDDKDTKGAKSFFDL